MNGQQRSSDKKDYSTLNLIHQVQVLENYRGHERILFMRPFANTYFGYLDNDFFGYTVPTEGPDRTYWLMEAKEAVDYYLDHFNIFFRIPNLEWSAFYSSDTYRPYIVALKFKHDQLVKKENGNKDKTTE